MGHGPVQGAAPPSFPVNIIILDDYQDAVRKLKCATILDQLNAKVFTNTVKGIGQLSVRLRDAEVLVLIRERTHFPKQLLEKLPKLRLISQTGRVGPHIDVETCTRLGIAVAEGAGSPVAPAELTWALIMAAMRRLPQYIGNLKHGAWQQSGLKAASMPPNFALGMVLKGKTLGIWGFGKIGQLVAGYGKAFGMRTLVWGSEGARDRAVAEGYEAADELRIVLRDRRRAEPAPAPARLDPRHRQARGAVADEADRPPRQHLARRADRGRRAGLGAQPRPAGHGRGRRVRERADPAGPPAAAPRERGLHAAHRLRRAGQLREVLRGRLRQRRQLHRRQSDAHRQSRKRSRSIDDDRPAR